MNFDSEKRKELADSIIRTVRNMRDTGAVLLVRGPELQKATTTQLRKAARVPKLVLNAFWTEGVETRNMVRTFVKQGKGQLLLTKQESAPTEDEIRRAVEQLKDLPRFLPFIVMVSMPVPGVTEGYVLLAVSIEKWLGQKVSLLPSSFRNFFEKLNDEPTGKEGKDDAND